MSTITGLTADRMLDIEANSVVDGEVVVDDLILTKHDGSTINAGNVRGPVGPAGGPAAANTITEAMLLAGATGLVKGAFRVYISADAAVPRGNYINFTQENHDYSGAHAAGVFSAPIKGLYHFDWSAVVQTVLGDNTWVQANLCTNPGGVLAVRLRGSTIHGDGVNNKGVSHGSGQLALNAGEQVVVGIDASGAFGQTLSGEESTMFGGHLIGRLP